MPIYEYRCHACQHELEVMQKVSEPPMLLCPACGKDSLNKLISRASFQLKGTGWYATDYKDSAKKAEPETLSETKSTADSSTKKEAPVASSTSSTATSTPAEVG